MDKREHVEVIYFFVTIFRDYRFVPKMPSKSMQLLG
jgi:hypothetical protein